MSEVYDLVAEGLPGPEGIAFDTIMLSKLRRTIARRLTDAKREIPHIYLEIPVGLDTILARRVEWNAAQISSGTKISINDMLIKAQALALTEVGACNVQFAEDRMYSFHRVDLSVAVSTPKGLITPIIRDAAAKSVVDIAREMKELAARAREGKLLPDEYNGGTATLSNMGMYGVRRFSAIINPPQAMILAIGASETQLELNAGKVRSTTSLSATGSFDHRVIDGTTGAAFMAAFKRLVENPSAWS